MPGQDPVPSIAPIGREEQVRALRSLVNQAIAGQKRAAVLTGPPGIGKSTLLRYAAEIATARGCLTASIRAPASAGLPHRFPVRETLVDLHQSLDERHMTSPAGLLRLLDTLQGRSTAEDYPASSPQIAGALEEIMNIAPVLILLDDYQWLPEDGRDLMLAALRVTTGRLLLVTTVRSAEGKKLLPESTADLWFDVIDLPPLSRESIEALAYRELDEPVLPALADTLFARTLGNPLFAVETLRTWRDGGLLTSVGGYASVEDTAKLPTPRSLEDLILSRSLKVSESARMVAVDLALLGRDASFDEVRALASAEAEDIVDRLEELRTEGIVITEGVRPIFRLAHPLYQSSLLDWIGPTKIAVGHQRIAEALRASGAAVSELAFHAIRALERPPDLRTIVEDAAVSAEGAAAFEEAADWFGHLASLCHEEPGALTGALEGQARTSINIDPTLAVTRYNEALALQPGPTMTARLLLGRARAERVLGDLAAADETLDSALPQADKDVAFEIRHMKSVLAGLRGDMDAFESQMQDLLALTPPKPLAPLIRGQLGVAMLFNSNLLGAEEVLRQAASEATRSVHEPLILANLGWVLTLLGVWSEAVQVLERAVDAAEARGDAWNLPTALSSLTRLHAWRGDFRAAFDAATRATRASDRFPNPQSALESHGSMAIALSEYGMAADAIAILDEIIPILESEPAQQERANMWSEFATVYLRASDVPRARHLWTQAAAEVSRSKHWAISVRRAEAEILLGERQISAAREAIDLALEIDSLIPFEAARAREAASTIAEAAGDKEAALKHAAAARTMYADVGARHREVGMSARLATLTPPKLGRPKSTLPFGLTPRELEVLELAAEGQTNAEISETLFLSVGTVRKHVENLMAKAGVSRRGKLAAFLQEVRKRL